MDNAEALGNRFDGRGKRQGEEIAADGEQNVVLGQGLGDDRGEPGHGAAEKGMGRRNDAVFATASV